MEGSIEDVRRSLSGAMEKLDGLAERERTLTLAVTELDEGIDRLRKGLSQREKAREEAQSELMAVRQEAEVSHHPIRLLRTVRRV